MKIVLKKRLCTFVAAGAVAAIVSFASPRTADAGFFFPLPVPPPGACVFADGSCQIAPQTICNFAGGVFLGSKTTCP